MITLRITMQKPILSDVFIVDVSGKNEVTGRVCGTSWMATDNAVAPEQQLDALISRLPEMARQVVEGLK